MLREEDVRHRFYRKLRAFVSLMHTGMASATWLSAMEATEKGKRQLDRYTTDRTFWLRLREMLRSRFAESIDFGSLEQDVRRILDAHIKVVDIEQLGKPVNIFDAEALQEAVDAFQSDEAKADKIASETARHLDEKKDQNRAVYQHYAAQAQGGHRCLPPAAH